MASISPSEERETVALLQATKTSSIFTKKNGLLAVFIASVLFIAAAVYMNTPSAQTSVKPDTFDFSTLPFSLAENNNPPKEFIGQLEPPYPTNAFWFNWVIDEGVGPAVLLPYSIKCVEEGIKVSYPAARRAITVTTESDFFQDDLIFTSAEEYAARYVTDYDEFSVTMHFDTESGGSYETIAVRGSPYATVLYDGATPVLKSIWSNVTTINGLPAAGVTVSGTEFLLEQQDGMRWLVFSSDSLSLSVSENGEVLSASEPFTGWIRAAVSPDTTTDALLSSYADTYPTGGSFDYTVENDTVTYEYTWNSVGDGDLLMGAVKHLTDIMAENTEFVATGTYSTMKGPVDLIRGNSWALSEELPTISWYAPRKIQDQEKLEEMMKRLDLDVLGQPPAAGDPYGAGKQFARMARMALIAEEYNNTEAQHTALKQITKYMDGWLTGTNPDPLVYETNYGGIVSSMGLDDWGADFGNGWYNDHHFHYGYFLYTLATVIKMDPSYYTEHQDAIDLILGDIGNRDHDSELFPVARHKDFYDHHSWALGLFATFDGKSQESSSEAVNAYYGMWLLGLALEDQELADWGRTLLAMELRGTHYYWQVHEGNEAIYDQFFAANKMIGQVGGLDAFCTTWFGKELEYIHGIQMLPFTPITEELLRYDYVMTEWPVVKVALDDPKITSAWTGVLYLDYAIVDPEGAWDLMTSLDPNTLDSGFSMANSMYWILTREDHGPYVEETQAPQVVQPSCSINQGCFNAGYTSGNCCPSNDGDYMSCCPVL